VPPAGRRTLLHGRRRAVVEAEQRMGAVARHGQDMSYLIKRSQQMTGWVTLHNSSYLYDVHT
jgi:hypothetical protein